MDMRASEERKGALRTMLSSVEVCGIHSVSTPPFLKGILKLHHHGALLSPQQ